MFFKTVKNYSVIEKVDNNVFVEPTFYNAYEYVLKQLKNKFEEHEMFEEIETEDNYYSIIMKMNNPVVLKNESTGRMKTSDFQELKLTPLFFEILEIMPYYTQYKLYNSEDIVEEKRIDYNYSHQPRYGETFTPETTKQSFDIKTIYEYKKITKGISDNYADKFNINQIFMYITLGELFTKNISNVELDSVGHYLTRLHDITTKVRTLFNSFEPDKEAYQMLSNLTNEERVLFYDALKEKNYTFIDFILEGKIRISRNEYVGTEYLVFETPYVIEPNKRNEDRLRAYSPVMYPLYNEVTLDEKLKDEEVDEFGGPSIGNMLDNLLKEEGYNVHLMFTKRTPGEFMYRAKRKHQELRMTIGSSHRHLLNERNNLVNLEGSAK